MANTRTVTLGDHTLPVVPQRHARLRRRLSQKDIEAIFTERYSEEAYRVLSVLIPAILPNGDGTGIPEYEWNGFASQEAQDADAYDEATDRSPTTAQMVDAFEAAIMVSGADRLGKIMGLVTALNSSGTPTQSSGDSSGSTGD